MNHHLITQTELAEMFGYSKAGPLLKCLREQGVPVLTGKDGKVCTTIDALNFALGVSVNSGIIKQQAKQQDIEL